MAVADLEIKRISSTDPNFDSELDALLNRAHGVDQDVHAVVVDIIERIRLQGDQALVQLTRDLDRLDVRSAAELKAPAGESGRVLARINPKLRQALENAADRIRTYHQRQQLQSWEYVEQDGTRLGQKVTALDRVGIYVPGGKAAYPSSVLMNAIPARIAGVKEIIMTVPTPGGEVNDGVLAAAAVAKVDQIFYVGGAQAIAALAYGTDTIPRVDKIVGPGNTYVATAKKLVFGQVGIDMFAGPSEVVVCCDASVDPEWIAMDLCAQAEHDELAQAIVISTDGAMLDRVGMALNDLVPTLERADIVKTALQGQGGLIQVKDMQETVQVINRIAPEHLQLMVDNPRPMVDSVRHAGAIFIGPYSAEALGDYCVGPNHVLPTSGTARFSSALGVYDFQKRTSLIECSQPGASELAGTASTLARAESLTAHARSAEYRMKQNH
ncbi:MAG: histidinol dehydrogenase [Arenicellales bacterium]|nr:histidinol dehydrogenase [Arenicellales bacterium]